MKFATMSFHHPHCLTTVPITETITEPKVIEELTEMTSEESTSEPSNSRPRHQESLSSSSSESDHSNSSVSTERRGRPAKPLCTHMPTIDDEEFKNMSPDEASREITKIKNNESSRKYRRNTKSKIKKMESECIFLSKKQKSLNEKKNRLNEQIDDLKNGIRSFFFNLENRLDSLTVERNQTI